MTALEKNVPLLYKHGLKRILDTLKPTRAEVNLFPSDLSLILESGQKIPLTLDEAHSAWRYGLPMDPVSEGAIVVWLKQIDVFIAKKRKKL